MTHEKPNLIRIYSRLDFKRKKEIFVLRAWPIVSIFLLNTCLRKLQMTLPLPQPSSVHSPPPPKFGIINFFTKKKKPKQNPKQLLKTTRWSRIPSLTPHRRCSHKWRIAEILHTISNIRGKPDAFDMYRGCVWWGGRIGEPDEKLKWWGIKRKKKKLHPDCKQAFRVTTYPHELLVLYKLFLL